MKNLETIIGLEIHIQLKTKSKMFCSCDNSDTDKPNKHICEVCTGQPGTLPKVNQQAIDYGIMMSLALNCDVQNFNKFDRKNYFYPDLPKGYQISQLDEPLALHGHLIIDDPVSGKNMSRIRINRLHLEEDAGKSIHTKKGETLVDLNRCGTPLAEIVTEPDFRSPLETKLFLQELQTLARYLKISDADMEKGNMRCDANISLRPEGEDKLYPKTEIKNLNSFKAVERSLLFEEAKQKDLWEEGKPPKIDATYGWDEAKQQTIMQRSKEDSADYRYFPEPDLPPLEITNKEILEISNRLPELPEAKRKRFKRQFGLKSVEANLISVDKIIADFFEATVSETVTWLETLPDVEGTSEEIWDKNKKKIIKLVFNYITTEIYKLQNETGKKSQDLIITPENMAELVAMIYTNKINSSAAQEILKIMFEKGGDPSNIVEENDLGQMSDEGEIETIINQVIKNNPTQVAEYKAGKEPVIMFLVGQVMKESKGKADPNKSKELLQKSLS